MFKDFLWFIVPVFIGAFVGTMLGRAIFENWPKGETSPKNLVAAIQLHFNSDSFKWDHPNHNTASIRSNGSFVCLPKEKGEEVIELLQVNGFEIFFKGDCCKSCELKEAI
jgi:hypothetical protein